jgi:hypothetical protein
MKKTIFPSFENFNFIKCKKRQTITKNILKIVPLEAKNKKTSPINQDKYNKFFKKVFAQIKKRKRLKICPF